MPGSMVSLQRRDEGHGGMFKVSIETDSIRMEYLKVEPGDG